MKKQQPKINEDSRLKGWFVLLWSDVKSYYRMKMDQTPVKSFSVSILILNTVCVC